MNPAYMTRQVYELEREVSGARSHLTSLKTLKPENAPDEWEKKALIAFEQGEKEMSSMEYIEGREYFRLMRPFITEEGCLKCHAKQGYKVNDIRGGISVSLPMDSIRELAGTSQSRNISIYLLLWLVGTGGIVFGYYRVSKSESKCNQAEKEREIAYLDLEKKVHDRTADLNKVNETLLKEQHFLAAVFDSIEEGIVACDANGVLTHFNRATRRMHGLPEEPIPADQWAQHYDLFLPDGKTPMQKEDVPLFRALQGEHVRNAEMMIIPKQGHARTLVASGQTLKDPEGKIIGAVVAMHDITERKQGMEALIESEEKFATIFKVAPGSIILSSLPDGKTVEVNDNFSLITGYSREEALGKTTGDLGMWADPSERDRFLSMLQTNGVVRDFEAELNHKSGAIRNGLISGHILTIQGKKYLLGTFYDITERKQAGDELRKYRDHLEDLVKERTIELEEAQEALISIVEDLNEKSVQLAQAMEQAQSADRLKSAFLATMSHELRTPLNSIIGFTGIVLQGMSGPLNEEQVKQLAMVKGSANHLLDLINDVLDISKIEAGQVQITRKSFDMRSVIEAALRTVLPLAAKKGLSLDSAIASDVGVIISDRRRVEQILINLLNNAIKFTKQGDVRIECRIKEGRLETCVHDTGIGIKPEDMGKLFIPFRQIDTGLARNHEGTGLGLSICLRLVEMLGGTIRAESEWGKGSAFTFTLPLG